jgi:hypothetical protein
MNRARFAIERELVRVGDLAAKSRIAWFVIELRNNGIVRGEAT